MHTVHTPANELRPGDYVVMGNGSFALPRVFVVVGCTNRDGDWYIDWYHPGNASREELPEEHRDLVPAMGIGKLSRYPMRNFDGDYCKLPKLVGAGAVTDNKVPVYKAGTNSGFISHNEARVRNGFLAELGWLAKTYS